MMMNRLTAPQRQQLLRGRGMIHMHISIFNNPSTNTSESSRVEGGRSKAQRAAATGGQAGVGVGQVTSFRNINTPLRAHGSS